MFERLCRDGVPTGPDIFEITRLCLPPTEPKTERRRLRDGLIHAMVAHGLEHGIHQFTGVVTARFRERILAMGWEGEALGPAIDMGRSEEHTSELQSLMRISYAVFCLKKKKKIY